MNDTAAALAVLVGLLVRLVIPILITALLVVVLTRLDRRWETEAAYRPVKVDKTECWKTQHCPSSRRKDCPALKSDLPCWQVFRHHNGYLDAKCLACPVFITAPALA